MCSLHGERAALCDTVLDCTVLHVLYCTVPHCTAEAYRHAVDLSPSDFRAWYGLGQAYELLKMPYYALYYYRCVGAVQQYRCVAVQLAWQYSGTAGHGCGSTVGVALGRRAGCCAGCALLVIYGLI